MVLAGHVHDFQRLTKTAADGTQVPYIVAGNGGDHNLHAIMKVDGQKMAYAGGVFKDKTGDPVTLEATATTTGVRAAGGDRHAGHGPHLSGAAAARGLVQQGQPADRLLRVRLKARKYLLNTSSA